jgi:hypothetical protein
VIAPAIDPLTSKNRELPGYLSRETVAELGIDIARPLMIQVSRFDPWKDPLGVVDVWREARGTFGELQLALVGAMAGDDPEAWRIYKELDEVEGAHCFDSVRAIPDGVDGVVIVTPPNATLDVATDCARAGVPRVWIHRGVGPGSSSEEAVAFCHEHGISVIPGGCPCMFGPTADPGHKCLRAMLNLTGKLPRTVESDSSSNRAAA